MSTKEEKVIEELKKSNLITTIAFASALLFMGIQFWPAEYTYTMKLSLAAIFVLLAFWIIWVKFFSEKKAEGKKARIFSKIVNWLLKITLYGVIILAIVAYIISWSRGF